MNARSTSLVTHLPMASETAWPPRGVGRCTGRHRNRWSVGPTVRCFIALAVNLVVAAGGLASPSADGTTTASVVIHRYDDLTSSRADAHQSVAAECCAVRSSSERLRADGRPAPEGIAFIAGSLIATNSEVGGAGPVRVGQAGEAAVQGAYDIGPKATVEIGGRTRILDGLTDSTVTEVKNVASQSYTQQLKDSLAYARSTGRSFDPYVRPDTYLTGPLRDAIAEGLINLKFIP